MEDEYNYLDAESWYTAFSVQQALAVLPHQQQDQNKLCRGSDSAGLVSAPAVLENRTRSSNRSCSERTVCNAVLRTTCRTAMQGNISRGGSTVPRLLSCLLVSHALSCSTWCLVLCREAWAATAPNMSCHLPNAAKAAVAHLSLHPDAVGANRISHKLFTGLSTKKPS